MAIYVVASLALAPLGLWVARRSRWAAIALAGGSVALLLVSAVWLLDNPRWVKYLPVTEAWLWSNPALPGAVLLASAAWRILPAIVWQRALLCTAVLCLGVDRSLGVLYRPAPEIAGDRWRGRVCIQTTSATCAPSAVATALLQIGVRTDEFEMTRAALTSASGTSSLGIYRALKVALAGRAIGIKLFEGDPADLSEFPTVIAIQGRVDSHILKPGARHAITLLGRASDGRPRPGGGCRGR